MVYRSSASSSHTQIHTHNGRPVDCEIALSAHCQKAIERKRRSHWIRARSTRPRVKWIPCDCLKLIYRIENHVPAQLHEQWPIFNTLLRLSLISFAIFLSTGIPSIVCGGVRKNVTSSLPSKTIAIAKVFVRFMGQRGAFKSMQKWNLSNAISLKADDAATTVADAAADTLSRQSRNEN